METYVAEYYGNLTMYVHGIPITISAPEQGKNLNMDFLSFTLNMMTTHIQSEFYVILNSVKSKEALS